MEIVCSVFIYMYKYGKILSINSLLEQNTSPTRVCQYVPSQL